MDLHTIKSMISGKWTQLTGKIKEEFNDLTGDELGETEGKVEKIAGMLQSKYSEKYASVEEAMEDAKRLATSIGEELE